MADNLPLLPDKGPLCIDVRTILHEVFRKSDHSPPFNGISHQASLTNSAPLETDLWINKLSLESAKLNNHEVNLQKEYAKRLAKDSLPNIYKLHSISVPKNRSTWKDDLGLLERKDLKPTLQQDATREESLWIKNILNGSSCNISTIKVTGSKIIAQTSLQLAEEISEQSISWGEIASMLPVVPPVSSLKTPLPDHIISIPPQLQFINFKIGQLYTQSLRLLNLSKFEMRVSIRPPAHRELDVQLCSRLVITSGSAAELNIHFRPNDVRVLYDKLLVRISSGQIISIPIECFMEPPILDIIIPTTTPRLTLSDTTITVQEVLDLGARLLGDVHRSVLVLRCEKQHASFFLLSEEAWLEYSVEVSTNLIDNISVYGVVVGCFFISPVKWSGGGIIHGLALCRAGSPGLHTEVLRVLCSTAIVRPLHLVADALLFCSKHIILQAQDKDYDICSEDDPACGYYVHLGTSFPKCGLSATVTIVNHSPVSYNYYWSARPWGVCSCWQQTNGSQESDEHHSDLCPGALQAKLETKLQGNNNLADDEASFAVRVEQMQGCLSPRHEVAMSIRVPDVGESLGLRRAVLMLVLTDIPKESFPPDYDPMIVNINVIEEEAIPGISPRWSREVCEVVCAEMEVWWEVVPIRFALDPPLLVVPYSRRVKSVTVTLRATQLYGVTSVKGLWEMVTPAPAPSKLLPGQSFFTTAVLSLKDLSNEVPETTYIRLVSEKAEWSVSSSLQHWPSNRALTLRQAHVWLGVLPPGSWVAATLTIFNETHQNMNWTGTCHRWYRERPVARACVGRAPCTACSSHACTCSALTPYRGFLNSTQQISLQYKANAPDTDGCVATLVQVRGAASDPSRPRSACVSQARASLVAYRVLAPLVTLTVMSCGVDKSEGCTGRGSATAGREHLSSVLRPRSALVAGESERCRLRICNITPIPTVVQWEQAIGGEEDLKVTFIPNEFDLGSYSNTVVMVLLEARRVTRRRLFVRRASVAHAYKPLYLLIDVSISGVEVIVEFPIGGEKTTDSSVSIKMIQKENPWNMSTKKTLCPAELFAEDDRKRALQKVNICNCRYKMLYIPPKKQYRPSHDCSDDHHHVETVEEPPPLTRTCPCTELNKPALPDDSEPYCLQFINLPLRTVRSRTITVRNVSGLDAGWRCAVRRHARQQVRTDSRDPWSGEVGEAGVVVACTPARGTVRAGRVVKFTVSVYADCWGLYYDQILIQIEDMEPLVVDVWIEVVGDALCFALRHHLSLPPVLWMSQSDPGRVVYVKNTSRTELIVYAYILKDNEYPQEELPFRLYLRLFDVPPRVCPCLIAFNSKSIIEEESRGSSVCLEEMDTGVELFLAPDYGVQDEAFYQVDPSTFSIKPQETTSLKVCLVPRREPAPPSTLLLRSSALNKSGDTWYRPPPGLQRLFLREAVRRSSLHTTCSEIRVALCALDMPIDNDLRVRKRFNVQNVGEGHLESTAVTEPPWRVDVARNVCDAHCASINTTYSDSTKIYFPPRSSIEMIAVLTVKTDDMWPVPGEPYLPRTIKNSALCFYDNEDVMLLKIPLILDLDMPILTTQPDLIDFGLICDGNTRKSYFSVKHSSMLESVTMMNTALAGHHDMDGFFCKTLGSAVIELVTTWSGDENFRIWPPSLTLSPGVSKRVYVEYTASWMRGDVSAGRVVVQAAGARRRWCAAAVQVRAFVSLRRPHPPADHTDDIHLMPLL